MQYRQHERGERENCCGASEGVGGADGGRARVEGCGKDAVLVERAFGAVSEVLSERGGGVKRNSRGGGEIVSGVVATRRFGAGICAGAGADGFGCFYWGNGGVVVGRRSVWAGGAEISVEDEFGRIDHRGHRGTERVLAKDRAHGMESPWKLDGSASHPYPGVSLGAAALRAERNQESVGCARGRA